MKIEHTNGAPEFLIRFWQFLSKLFQDSGTFIERMADKFYNKTTIHPKGLSEKIAIYATIAVIAISAIVLFVIVSSAVMKQITYWVLPFLDKYDFLF
ncbi:MAG: hypothetical protein K8S56_08200 [Candidatus Cloacimonetes bacterium]|nr:hypothetical protein [Candidatus Cloacimonadota bacterium]